MNEMVKRAIESVTKGGFNCMPLPDFRDPEIQFDTEIQSMVAEAGCQL